MTRQSHELDKLLGEGFDEIRTDLSGQEGLVWYRPEFVGELIHSWREWLGRQEDPKGATMRLLGLFHYYVAPGEIDPGNSRLLDLLKLRDLGEGQKTWELDLKGKEKGDVASVYAGVSNLLKLLLGANPIAMGHGQNLARLVASVPRVRQVSSTFACGASGFDEVIMRIGTGICLSDLGSLPNEDLKRCTDFVDLHLKFMKRYYLAIRCWEYLSRTVLRDKQNRLLLLIGYGEKPSDSDYASLRATMEGVVRKRETEYVSDAVQTDDLLGDFIEKAMMDIRTLSEAEVVEEALKGSYSSLGLRHDFLDQLKSHSTKARDRSVEYEDDSEDGSEMVLEILSAASQYSASGEDEDQREWAVENVSGSGKLSDEARCRLAEQFGPSAPKVIEVIMYSPDDILKKNQKSFNQRRIAEIAGCSENTFGRLKRKLKERAVSSADQRQWLFDLIDLKK